MLRFLSLLLAVAVLGCGASPPAESRIELLDPPLDYPFVQLGPEADYSPEIAAQTGGAIAWPKDPGEVRNLIGNRALTRFSFVEAQASLGYRQALGQVSSDASVQRIERITMAVRQVPIGDIGYAYVGVAAIVSIDVVGLEADASIGNLFSGEARASVQYDSATVSCSVYGLPTYPLYMVPVPRQLDEDSIKYSDRFLEEFAGIVMGAEAEDGFQLVLRPVVLQVSRNAGVSREDFDAALRAHIEALRQRVMNR